MLIVGLTLRLTLRFRLGLEFRLQAGVRLYCLYVLGGRKVISINNPTMPPFDFNLFLCSVVAEVCHCELLSCCL